MFFQTRLPNTGPKVTLGWLLHVHPKLTHRDNLAQKIQKHIGLADIMQKDDAPPTTVKVYSRKVFAGKCSANALHIAVPKIYAAKATELLVEHYNHSPELPGHFMANGIHQQLGLTNYQTLIRSQTTFVANTYVIPITGIHPGSLNDPITLANSKGETETKTLYQWITAPKQVTSVEPTMAAAATGKHFVLTTKQAKRETWQHIDELISYVYCQDLIPVTHRYEDQVPSRGDKHAIPLWEKSPTRDNYLQAGTATLPAEGEPHRARKPEQGVPTRKATLIYDMGQEHYPALHPTNQHRSTDGKSTKLTKDTNDDIKKLMKAVQDLITMVELIAKHVGFQLPNPPGPSSLATPESQATIVLPTPQATPEEQATPVPQVPAKLQTEAPMTTDETSHDKRKRTESEDPLPPKHKAPTQPQENNDRRMQALEYKLLAVTRELEKSRRENAKLKQDQEGTSSHDDTRPP